jgi:two-component system capsular synthesis response regulator RcsB
MKINLILADDHPALLAGIKHELSGIRTLGIVGTARNSTEIVALLSKVRCDILITDYAMPGGEFGDGMAMLWFLRRRYPDLKIIVFTTIDNPAIIAEMRKLGVRSVLNKVDDVDHLISAIHAVYAGATYAASNVDASPRSDPQSTAPADVGKLTRREAEVVRLYVSGISINEIAAQMNRTKQTVSGQKISAMRKLGIKRDADLFRFAYETGLAVAGRPLETTGEDRAPENGPDV